MQATLVISGNSLKCDPTHKKKVKYVIMEAKCVSKDTHIFDKSLEAVNLVAVLLQHGCLWQNLIHVRLVLDSLGTGSKLKQGKFWNTIRKCVTDSLTARTVYQKTLLMILKASGTAHFNSAHTLNFSPQCSFTAKWGKAFLFQDNVNTYPFEKYFLSAVVSSK